MSNPADKHKMPTAGSPAQFGEARSALPVQRAKVTFESVFIEFKDSVYGMALAMTGNADDAAEISQDVFLKVHAHLGSFRGESSVKTWVCNIARNTTLTFLRKRSLRKATPMDETVELADMRTQPEAVEMHTETKQALIGAVARLPEDHRTCIALHYLQNCSVKEVAELTGWGVSKVKMTLCRARKQLFTALAGMPDIVIE